MTKERIRPMPPTIKTHVQDDIDFAWEDSKLNCSRDFLIEAVLLGQYLQAHCNTADAVRAFIGNDEEDLRRARNALGLDEDEDIPMTLDSALAFLHTREANAYEEA